MKTGRIFNIVAASVIAASFSSCNCCAKTAKLQNEIDSLNYAFGIANGAGIRDYYLQADTTDTNIKALLKGLNEAVNSKDESKRFYALGINIGSSMKMQTKAGLLGDSTLIADMKVIAAGLADAIKKEGMQFTADSADIFLRAKMEQLQAQKAALEFSENKEAGEKFLAENKEREGVVTTESGLQYEILKAGNGEKPLVSDKVKVHYHGTLIDGTVFDSSVNRGKPAEFIVNNVIKGWIEALQMMQVGSKWKVFIPAELAYGANNTGSIKPFSTLIFEIELLGIEKEEKAEN